MQQYIEISQRLIASDEGEEGGDVSAAARPRLSGLMIFGFRTPSGMLPQ
jgi:hypothetical protein